MLELKHKKLQAHKHVLMFSSKKYIKAHVLLYFLLIVPTFIPQCIKVYITGHWTSLCNICVSPKDESNSSKMNPMSSDIGQLSITAL